MNLIVETTSLKVIKKNINVECYGQSDGCKGSNGVLCIISCITVMGSTINFNNR